MEKERRDSMATASSAIANSNTNSDPSSSGESKNSHDSQFSLPHLLGIQDLSKAEICALVEEAAQFLEISDREIKKVPALRGKTIFNVFLEPSTRTRVSFEVAGKRLSADTINISSTGTSVKKGESLVDTARTLQAMNPDIVVIRHQASGAARFLAHMLQDTVIINAGDGKNEHPTQCLLDLLTLRKHFDKPLSELNGLNISIIGDVLHSRVTKSNVWGHLKLGNNVRLVAPPTMAPEYILSEKCFGVPEKDYSGSLSIHHTLSEGLKGADVVMTLRPQLERQDKSFIGSLDEYSYFYGLSREKLDRFCPNSVLLHPGPATRGVEITGELMYENRSLMEDQVKNGVAVRMAALFRLGTTGTVNSSKDI